MRFDLVSLRLFLLVLEHGSITHGAEQAHLSLASASARLRAMEDAIGLPLLERGSRGVSPTSAGDTLAHHARMVLRQIDQMEGELREHAAGMKVQVRLWANTSAVTEFLPDRLAPFLGARPNVSVDLRERLSTETVKAVLAEVADVGIVSDAVDHGALQTFPFAIDRLVLVAAREGPGDSLLAGRRDVALAEVLGQPFVGLSPGSPLQEHLAQHAALAGRSFDFRARVRTFDGVCRMAAHGVGFGIVPETAARRHRTAPRVQAWRLSDPWATRRLLVCVRSLDALPRPVRELVAYLVSGN